MALSSDGRGIRPPPAIRLGIDVVSISRLGERLGQWPRMEERIFTAAESSYARSRPNPLQHLAGRLAAKEATFKALGTGWPMMSWLNVEVVSEGSRASLKLSGRAEAEAGQCTALVSMSHDAGIAVAQVVLMSAH